ncbi:MAG TPA: hypothetical protein VIX17_14225 [Pyrinomonadaceae bacterium]
MFHRLTSPSLVESACIHITALIHQHAEWFCTQTEGDTYALMRNEIEVIAAQGRLILSCWTEKGSKSWRILAWFWNGQTLTFQASKRMGAETPLIELVPRASAKSIAAAIKAARQIRCYKLAELASSIQSETRIERCALSPGIRHGQPGRYARILLRRKQQRIAVTGSVVTLHNSSVDAFLSSALLWFERTANRIKPPYIEQLWLIVSSESLKATRDRIALLRESLQNIIKIFTVEDSLTELVREQSLERRVLWKRKLARFPPVPAANVTPLVSQIIRIAPEAIDVVHARHGETLRYFGLPFGRVRSLLGTERLWFGLDSAHRRMLDDSTGDEWRNLLTDLQQCRSAVATDYRHALYRNASEAWLESLLRKDITKLDPGLIIAPLHAQFRTARGGKLGVRPIDMLALRQDGRLVVIELKVAEDREHVLQGADYWRRVEAHRRRGHITKAKLFGDRPIRDESPLVYLVAPMLRVHPSFPALVRCIAHDIEIYRFDINEDWRLGVRVMRRVRVN